MIAGIKADDDTIRRLSRIPEEVTIPAALRTDRARRAPGSLLEDLLFLLWILLIIGWCFFGFTVFIGALTGMPGLQTGAITGLLVASWATAGVTAYTAMYLTIRRDWAGAAFWLAVTAGISVPTLLGTQALLSS
ncbi:hypothetical protein [Microbacterium rhizomatis]|uniref:Uncharacterized protein n=1 Tax=Microbacterium rhizomatis TaxID=1631477 RepID=A0A5J5J3Y7_9MICO|nr:hypothetical protein [Microbacterium rhizomatis]KAA9107958.1 hypothetical protein F6B43_11070 [Microbacterium rhizomatis]